MNSIWMMSMSNAEFSEIDDIDITFIGYGIDTLGEEKTPQNFGNRARHC